MPEWTYAQNRWLGSSTNVDSADFVSLNGTIEAQQTTINGNTFIARLSGHSDTRKEISPTLYFAYIKSKLKPFSVLEERKLKRRLDELEKSAEEAQKNGQVLLEKKCLTEWFVRLREAEIYAKGVTTYVEWDDIQKKRNLIRKGNISDTKLKDYIRAIPKSVVKKIDRVRSVFDDFVILHYFNESQKDVKSMTPDEKEKTKDPIVFGIIGQNNRMYYVADWKDEFCDLTFEELTRAIAKQKV